MKGEISFLKRLFFLSVLVMPLLIFIAIIMASPKPMKFIRAPSVGGFISTVRFHDCFDLDTSTIVTRDTASISCDGQSWDLNFGYSSGRVPHTVLFQNRPSTLLAYSQESYELLDLGKASVLNFMSNYIAAAFTEVATIRTAIGNYYKVQFIEESETEVTFQWEKL